MKASAVVVVEPDPLQSSVLRSWVARAILETTDVAVAAAVVEIADSDAAVVEVAGVVIDAASEAETFFVVDWGKRATEMRMVAGNC